MQKIPITIKGVAALRQELDKLKTQDRPRIAKAIGEARAHGDLRENAEYHAAKETQGFIEAKIRDIENKLINANVIDVTKLPRNGIVVFGTTVHLINIDIQVKNVYQLVGDDEADIKQNKISINSPIARALVGKKVGDITSVTTPSGVLQLEITKIEYI
ncbi:MAG: transcription elongation factor GreA [Coxiellaceae bacterium]|jgi:transcription elongation factor GreA|nr:transcription elongation factor GreA [Coxiellaceae bacterium]